MCEAVGYGRLTAGALPRDPRRGGARVSAERMQVCAGSGRASALHAAMLLGRLP
jgi:hypothetical protein